jgi:hypothetical protein
VSLELRSVDVAAETYSLDIPAVRRATGTIDAAGTVTATGTYPILTQATGTVTLFNYSGAPVDVEPGTLVATGEEPGAQAFSTVTPVVVPKGTLLADGRIQGGEATVPVEAFAAGPGGNVAARAIDTVLSEGPRNRLRAFAQPSAPLVVNTDPTIGGTESSGLLMLQEDVDAAVTALERALADALAEELGADDLVLVPVGDPPDPVIEIADGLVGTQDQQTSPISGTLAYDQWLVDPDVIESTAADRLAADAAAVPADHRLVPGATSVRIIELAGTEDGVIASVEVAGRAEAIVDEAGVIERIRGRSVEDAEEALDGLGRAEIAAWPGWVASVPEVGWRIDVRIASADEPGATPAPSMSP